MGLLAMQYQIGLSMIPDGDVGVHASPDGADVVSPVSLVEWFLKFYDQTHQGHSRPVEGIVRAGEVLFVPQGWWHLAMNLEVCRHTLTATACVSISYKSVPIPCM